ncbi:MAG: MFS transporter, partial [Chloroflexota bacterium]
MTFLTRHPLFQTLSELKGNSRIIVLTEVLFGIPFNMYMPFFSVYMKQIGLSDQQIGGLASVGIILQVITSLLSGAIVDKFGRRLVLMVTDIVSWGLACIVWAVAQDVRYFVVAVVLNSTWRIAHTAWTCLMVEDTEERHLVHIWTWIMIFSVVSALLTPVGGYFVNRFGLIPAERGILLFGSFMFTLKALLLFFYSHETNRGI